MNKRAIAFLQKMEEVKKAKANKQKQLQEKPIVKTEKTSVSKQQLIPIKDLKTQYNYTCPRCNGFIYYDTLWLNDLTGKYIALDPISLRPHHCGKKNNGIINVDNQIFARQL